MRTQDDIVARIAEVANDDFLGFQREVLIGCLDFAHAKPFLKDEVTDADWTPPLTDDAVKDEAREYMAFAWDKVQNHRGISASRSVEKISAWVWVLGDAETLAKIDAADYPMYGAPQLLAACEAYGWPVPDDEAVRRMARGESCVSDCMDGCGLR